MRGTMRALWLTGIVSVTATGCGRGGVAIVSGGGDGDETSTGTTGFDDGGPGSWSATTPTSADSTWSTSGPSTFSTSSPTITDSDTATTFPTVTFTASDSFSTSSPTDSDTFDDTGFPGECFGVGDCPPIDPCSAASCVDFQCQYAPVDFDMDGHAPFQCGGGDCNDLNPNTHPGAVENCFDNDDNDCNGVADCFDPACDGGPCGCVPSPEICGNGLDEDCDTAVDCGDTDCIGTPACGCAMSETNCVDGFDDDCDMAFDCDDTDCGGDPACTCMAVPEQCGNGIDDDCDLLIDCADPVCGGVFPCTCVGPPAAEMCADGVDNDCDALVDCADPDCFLSPACAMCTLEVCDNMADDDCDGMIDCADPGCIFAPTCVPSPEICNNAFDDDGDGLTDCDDPECAAVPICVQQQANCNTALQIFGSGTFFGNTDGNVGNHEGTCGGLAGEALFVLVLTQPSFVHLDTTGTSFDSVLYVRAGDCETGVEIGCDDDSAGFWNAQLDFTILYQGTYYIFVDGYTVDPIGGANDGPFTLNVIVDPNPVEQCTNTLDDDGDIYADCADSDCTTVPPCAGCVGGADPTPEFGTAACTDGIDNDCDGDIDCADDDCSASDWYVTECCNGMDQNGNGIPDDFNCRCAVDAECDPGQMCYDHTANTCGIPCTSFFGDVCPFVAPGSSCNPATDQCEF